MWYDLELVAYSGSSVDCSLKGDIFSFSHDVLSL